LDAKIAEIEEKRKQPSSPGLNAKGRESGVDHGENPRGMEPQERSLK